MKNFIKHFDRPVFGDESTGTVFDAYIWVDNGRYRMDFSWRTKMACAVTFSDDGIHWDEPIITLENNLCSGWEDDINRNCVIKMDGIYKMWYTGQAHGQRNSEDDQQNRCTAKSLKRVAAGTLLRVNDRIRGRKLL